MIKLNIEKLICSLCETEDSGCHDDTPALKYLHRLVILNSMEDKNPTVAEVYFDAFTQADLEEYHEIAIDAVENIFPQVEQLANLFR